MKKLKSIALALIIILCFGAFYGCKPQEKSERVNLIIWHYYNGKIQTMFDDYVKEFNDTYGKENNLIITAKSQGSIGGLTAALIASANKEPGAEPMPDMFSSYTDTAYMVSKIVPLCDFNELFTNKEINEFVPAYMEDGVIGGRLTVFPMLKSTEVMIMEKDIWAKFTTDDTTVSESMLATEEGIIKVSEKYGVWAKAKREELIKEKKAEEAELIPLAFYGRDATDNYFLTGMSQLGKEVYTVDDTGKATITFDKAAAKKLFDNYYNPYLEGKFSHEERFVTGCIANGDIVAGVGSSAAASNYPDRNLKILPAPIVNETAAKNYTLQGAGICGIKADKSRENAYAEFIKWFTEVERNIDFSIETGYLPVKLAANNYSAIAKRVPDTVSEAALETIRVALSTVSSADRMQTAAFFDKSNDVRNLLKTFSDKCAKDIGLVNQILKGYKEGDEIIAADPVKAEQVRQEFLSPDTFESWYTGIKSKMEALVV